MSYKKDLKKVMVLYPDIEIKSSRDYTDLINIHNILEATFDGEVDKNLVTTSFLNKDNFKLDTPNDYYYLVFKSAIDSNSFKKLAYPMMFGMEPVDEEFDLEKWAGLVHKIFDAVSSGDMSLTSAINYYAGTLDRKNGEDEKFKQWVKYYQDGEHLKYNEEEFDFKKEGFQFPLNGPGFYNLENAVTPKREDPVLKEKQKVDKENDYQEWRNKLHSAIRRIDKLLRQSDDFVDIDTQRDLADLLHHFDQEVRTLRHEKTASDLAYKYAHKLKAKGFEPGYKEFMKETMIETARMAPAEV